MVIGIVLHHRQVGPEMYIQGGGISSKTTAIDRKETVPYINVAQINIILPYVQNPLVNPILE